MCNFICYTLIDALPTKFFLPLSIEVFIDILSTLHCAFVFIEHIRNIATEFSGQLDYAARL